MGWNSQNVTSLLIITSAGGFTGLFAYSPAPGHGNLIASITAATGTDPFGNAYGIGVTTYGTGPTGPDTAQIGFHVAGSFPALGWISGASSETRAAQMTESVVNPNTPSEVIELAFFGPQGGSPDSVGMQLLSSSAAAPAISTNFLFYIDTAGSFHQVAFYGQHGFTGAITAAIIGAQPGTINTTLAAETWHTVTAFGAGFAAGSPAPRYRFEPIGGGGVVRLEGEVSVTGATAAGATMFTLPAGYVPARGHPFVTLNATGTVTGGSVNVTNAGLVQCIPASALGDAVWLDGVQFALD